MAVQFTSQKTLKAALLALVLLLVFSGSALAQSELFQALPSLRSAVQPNNPKGITSRTPVTLGDQVDPSFFNVSLDGDSLLGLSTRVNTSRSSLRSSNTKSMETIRGVLLNEDGEAVGNYVSSEVQKGDQKAYHMLFRLAASEENFILNETSAGEYSLDTQDHNEMPDCGHDDHAQDETIDAHSIQALRSSVTTTSTTTLDVLVLYTPEALDYATSELSMEALINQAIALSNDSYENSNVALNVNLVHSALTNDNESGSFSTDLTHLQASNDGIFDEAQTLRDEYYADMVVLLVAPGDYCGLGYVPGSLTSLQGGELAYSVVAANCVDYYSFQHEVGHNLGLQHDADNGSDSTLFEGSYGYRWNGSNSQTYRSVMAYLPGKRVPYFSNPEVSYEGGSTGVDGEANNSATLAAASILATNYRINPNSSSGSEGEETEETPEAGSIIEPAVSLEISQTSSKKEIAFEVTALDSLSNGVAGTTVNVYKKTRKKQVLLTTLTTDDSGVATYSAKRKRKNQKLLFEIQNVTSITKKVSRKR